MAKNISLLGADYPDVPAVQLPQTGGGTATFYDISYEGGSWTPVFPRDTVTNLYAEWIVIGNILFLTAQWTNAHGSGASYITKDSLPTIPGKTLNYGLHGTWRSYTTDVAGEIGQFSPNDNIRFSKGGVGVELPNEPISFNAFAFLKNA